MIKFIHHDLHHVRTFLMMGKRHLHNIRTSMRVFCVYWVMHIACFRLGDVYVLSATCRIFTSLFFIDLLLADWATLSAVFVYATTYV